MKLGIQKKVVISIVIVGMLPLLVGLYLTYLDGKTTRRNSIGASFQELAKETADKIDMVIGREVIDTQRLALSPNIRAAIKKRGSDPALIHYLREFKRYDERAVHSLLVVDSEGRFIAGINESNKGDYKNENWFTGAYNGDKGRVYVGDLKLEGETDVYLINIAVPVMDGGAAIGLLVIRYSVDKLLSVINSVRIEETGHANLVDSSGTIIMCPIFPLRSHQVSSDLIATISQTRPGWGVVRDDAHGGHGSIIGFAPVRSTIISENGWFDGKRWYIFTRQSPEEVYAPIYALLSRISLFGAALIALLSLMGVYAARKIVKPIDELYKGVEHFERGDLGYRLAIKTNDEIEKLADEFNRMAGTIQETYSNLQNRTMELETSEERYKDLIENSPEMIHSVNADRFFVNVNKTELNTVGYALAEMMRMRIDDIVPDDFRERMKDHIAQAIEKGISTVEAQFITKNGRRIDVEVTATALYDPISGEFVRTRAFVRDITERKKLEGAIRESEEKYKNLFDSLTDSLFMLDTEGRVTAVNRKQEEVLGYLRDIIIGREFPAILSEEDRKKFADLLERTLGGNNQPTVEVSVLNQRGELLIMEMDIIGIRKNEKMDFMVIHLRDITKKKELEGQLLRAERFNALSHFSSMLAHDLRNPIIGIRQRLKSLQSTIGTSNPKVTNRVLADIISSSELLLGLINDVLDVYQNSYEDLPLIFSTFPVTEAVEEAIKLLQIEAEEKNMRVCLHCEDRSTAIHADMRRLKRVFINLLDNAIQYSDAGGKVDITFRLTGDGGDELLFAIEDEGIGIPPLKLASIFEPLYKVGKKESKRGTGLGLYFCKVIVDAHCGKIWAENRPEKGAVFYITLPVRGGEGHVH